MLVKRLYTIRRYNRGVTMNPNKPRIKCEFKDACGLFAPACYDKRHANCKEYETRKRLAALERENKELKEKLSNAQDTIAARG